MKRRFLSVKELAEELGVHEDTIYRAHLKKLIPVQKVCKVLRFELDKVLKAFAAHAATKQLKQIRQARDRRRQPAARTAETAPVR